MNKYVSIKWRCQSSSYCLSSKSVFLCSALLRKWPVSFGSWQKLLDSANKAQEGAWRTGREYRLLFPALAPHQWSLAPSCSSHSQPPPTFGTPRTASLCPVRGVRISSEIWVPAWEAPPPCFKVLVTLTSFLCYHLSGSDSLQLSTLDYLRAACLLSQPTKTCMTSSLLRQLVWFLFSDWILTYQPMLDICIQTNKKGSKIIGLFRHESVFEITQFTSDILSLRKPKRKTGWLTQGHSW